MIKVTEIDMSDIKKELFSELAQTNTSFSQFKNPA